MITSKYNDIPDPHCCMYGGTSWNWVNANKKTQITKSAEVKLAAVFKEGIVKQAKLDVLETYKSLGPAGQSIFRRILPSCDADIRNDDKE